MSERSLGEVPVESGTVEHDFTMMSAYQEYSGHLLQLSVAAIGGIWLVLTSTESSHNNVLQSSRVRGVLDDAAVCFAVCSALALLHRYCAADGMAFHLEGLRRRVRSGTGDSLNAASAFRRRNLRYAAATWALRFACIWLAGGIILVSLALV